MITNDKDTRVQLVENLRGGNKTAKLNHLVESDKLKSKAKLFVKITLEKDASIGLHEHSEDFEIYYILKGTGIVSESDGNKTVVAGDVIYTADGQTHAIKNIEDEDLEFLAVVINE